MKSILRKKIALIIAITTSRVDGTDDLRVDENEDLVHSEVQGVVLQKLFENERSYQ